MILLALSMTAVAEEPEETGARLEIDALAEAYWSWNFNDPENKVTSLRGFDSRHATPALSIAYVGVGLQNSVLRGRIALQVGDTPASYTLVEPTGAGGPGVAPHDRLTAAPIREAWVGATAPVLDGLSLDAGVFLSPIGFDAIVARDNKFWSLSDLGFGLPFYLTGGRATLAVGPDTTVTGGVFGGWNSVVDNDDQPSFGLWWNQTLGSASLQVLWFGGDEGTGGFRNLLDAWVLVPVGPVEIVVHGDTGLEPRDGDLHAWGAGALAVVVHPADRFDVGVRGDVFHEGGTDANIFWPTHTIGSVTLSTGWRPVDGLLVRLEGRHDRADGDVFFGSDPDAPTESSQTTLTLGVSGSFAAAVPLRQ